MILTKLAPVLFLLFSSIAFADNCTPADFSNNDVTNIQNLLVQDQQILIDNFEFSFSYAPAIGSENPKFKVNIANRFSKTEVTPVWRFDCEKKLITFGIVFPFVFNFYNSYNEYIQADFWFDVNSNKMYLKLSGDNKKDLFLFREINKSIMSDKVKDNLLEKINKLGTIKLNNPSQNSVFNSDVEKETVMNSTITFSNPSKDYNGIYMSIAGNDFRLDGSKKYFMRFVPSINSKSLEETNTSIASWSYGAVGVNLYINGIDKTFGSKIVSNQDGQKLLIIEVVSNGASSFHAFLID